MTSFAYSSGNPANLTGGHSASMSDISGPLTDIPTFLNGANLDTSNLAASAKPATLLGQYRTIETAYAQFTGSQSATTKLIQGSTTGPILGTHGNAISLAWQQMYLDPADYAVSGLTAKYRLVGSVVANATAPAITFTFGLYPFTLAGGTSVITPTLGTVTSGSTAAVVSPGASAATATAGSDFTPPTAGGYAFGVVFSGITAANSFGMVDFKLQVRHV